jgi:outer membrane protein
MKKVLNIAITILSLAAVAAALWLFAASSKAQPAAAQAPLIGFVDSEKIISNYPPAVDANKTWDDYVKQQDEQIKAAIIQKYKIDDISSLPREAQLDVQKMIEENDAQRDRQYQQINKEKWEPTRAKIQTAIETVSKTKGIAVVLEKKAVLAGGLDLTDDVLSTLGKQ